MTTDELSRKLKKYRTRGSRTYLLTVTTNRNDGVWVVMYVTRDLVILEDFLVEGKTLNEAMQNMYDLIWEKSVENSTTVEAAAEKWRRNIEK